MRPFLCFLALLALFLFATPALLQAEETGGAEDTGSAEYGERLDEALTGDSDEAAPDETTIDEAVPDETTTDESTTDEPATGESTTGEPTTGESTTDEAATGATEPAAPAPAPAPAAVPAPAPAPAATPAVTDTAATDAPAEEGTDGEQAAPDAGPPADETPEQKGLRLAEEAKEAGEGFKWQTASGRMILRDAQGNTNERSFDSRILEDLDESDEEGSRGIIIFQHPPDIKNTALLTIGQKHADDHQWLYLPALKRVKRISGTSKTGAFVGSEFSFEDLSASAIEDYTYLWLAEEPCPGAEDLACNKVERKPKDDESGYSRLVVWNEVGNFRAHKTDFYDRKGTLLKTLTISNQQLFKDRYWRAMDLVMLNHITGKSTQMTWSKYDFETPLAEADFTVRALERLQ